MLFTTVDAIRKYKPDCAVYYASDETCNMSEYTFGHVFYSNHARQIALQNQKLLHTIKAALSDTAKYLKGKKENLWCSNDLSKLIKETECIVDLSGFALGDKWPVKRIERYLDGIRLAQKYQIPIILMPQSFGPFCFKPEQSYLLDEMKALLPYADIIFAREKEGYAYLKEQFGLSNVRLSSDLVLQSEGVDPANIWKHPQSIAAPEIRTDAVGIVPNKKCFTFGSKNDILNLYRGIMDELRDAGKKLYILRHSKEDREVCRWIYECYADDPDVYLLENDFSCLEYDEIVKHFQFIICSRFHGAVHAYRNAVPCVLLGWAVKYQELAELLQQGNYVFNIVENASETTRIRKCVQGMLQNYENESEIIKNRVAEIQRESCLDCLKKYIK